MTASWLLRESDDPDRRVCEGVASGRTSIRTVGETWIRTHLPWFFIDLGIARKGHDCEAVGGWHHWYNIDNTSSGRYHCEVVRSGRLWEDETGPTAEDANDLDAEDVLPLEGPVERVDGKLTLVIPLHEGGDKFLECCRGISEVQGNSLRIAIPEWLSGTLRIEDGDLVNTTTKWTRPLYNRQYVRRF